MNPLSAVIKAVTFPFHWIFVVGLCFFVNWLTSPGQWWVQWVAFGMTIALVCVWVRALKAIVVSFGLGAGAYLVHRWWSGRTPAARASASFAPATGEPDRTGGTSTRIADTTGRW